MGRMVFYSYRKGYGFSKYLGEIKGVFFKFLVFSFLVGWRVFIFGMGIE